MPRSGCAPARRPRAGRRRTGGGAPTNCSHGLPRRAPDGYGPGGAAGELVEAQSRAVKRGVLRYSLLRAPPAVPRPDPPNRLSPFSLLASLATQNISVKRSVVVPLHSNLFGGFVHWRCWRGQARVPLIKLVSGRRPSKGATAPQPAATLAPASTYTLLRRRPCHSHEVPIQRALCPPTERVTTVSQVL